MNFLSIWLLKEKYGILEPFITSCNNITIIRLSTFCRSGSRRVAKFLSESNTFHIKSKSINMLSRKNVTTLLDPPLFCHIFFTSILSFSFLPKRNIKNCFIIIYIYRRFILYSNPIKGKEKQIKNCYLCWKTKK